MEFSDLYCTPDLARKYCNDLKGQDDDSFINVLIAAASRRAERDTSRYFGPSAVVTDEQVGTVIGAFGNMFYTEWAPIISVTTLYDNIKTYVENTDFVTWLKEGRIETLDNSMLTRISFSARPAALKISYVVGQGVAPTGEFTGGIAAPADVQLAVAMITGHFYSAQDRLGIVSRTRGDVSSSFDSIDTPPTAKLLLSHHVRHLR